MIVIKEDVVDINQRLFKKKIQGVVDKVHSNFDLQTSVEQEVEDKLKVNKDILRQFSLKSLKTIPRCLLDFSESTSAIERIHLCLPFKFVDNYKGLDEDEKATMDAAAPHIDRILDTLLRYNKSFKELYEIAETAPLPNYVIQIFSYSSFNCENMINKFMEFKKYLQYTKLKEIGSV